MPTSARPLVFRELLSNAFAQIGIGWYLQLSGKIQWPARSKLACYKWKNINNSWNIVICPISYGWLVLHAWSLLHTNMRISIYVYIHTHMYKIIYTNQVPKKAGSSHGSLVQQAHMLHAAYKTQFWQTLCWLVDSTTKRLLLLYCCCLLLGCWHSLLIVKVIDILVVHLTYLHFVLLLLLL